MHASVNESTDRRELNSNKDAVGTSLVQPFRPVAQGCHDVHGVAFEVQPALY